MTLKELIKPFQSDIDQFTSTYEDVMRSNIPLVDTIAKYLVKYKGKQLRPLLVVMTARLCGKPTEHTYTAAAVVELLHVASLVHDDVIDNSETRRGFASIKSKWTNKIAVLMGDYLLSKSLIGATKTDQLEVMRILATAAKRLTKGELFQLEKSKKLDLTETEYYELISDKTAALFTACTELGVVTSTQDEAHLNALSSFGENLGIAFQIKDDLLDYESKLSIIGKPAGSDILESKLTLPLIHSLNVADSKTSKALLKQIKKGLHKKDIKPIIQFVVDHGGLEYTREKAESYVQKAKDALSIFPDNEYKASLLNVVDYVTHRKK